MQEKTKKIMILNCEDRKIIEKEVKKNEIILLWKLFGQFKN